jgi:hypothetical protein
MKKKEDKIDFLKRLSKGQTTLKELVQQRERQTKTVTLLESATKNGFFPGEKENPEDYLTESERLENCIWKFHILKISHPPLIDDDSSDL